MPRVAGAWDSSHSGASASRLHNFHVVDVELRWAEKGPEPSRPCPIPAILGVPLMHPIELLAFEIWIAT